MTNLITKLKQKNINYKKTIGIVALFSTVLLSNEAMADFDLNRGVEGFFNPLIQILKDHYPKGVLASGVGGALVEYNSDGRTKVINAAKYMGLAYLVVLGAFAALG